MKNQKHYVCPDFCILLILLFPDDFGIITIHPDAQRNQRFDEEKWTHIEDEIFLDFLGIWGPKGANNVPVLLLCTDTRLAGPRQG